MFKLQEKQPNGKWVDRGFPAKRFASEADAWEAAAAYDEDGYVHPALWRVVPVEQGK